MSLDRSVGTALLDVLAHDLRRARDRVRDQRLGPSGRGDRLAFDDAQHALWQALEAYVGALDGNGLPVPRQVRSDLQMHRRLFGDRR